MSANGRLSSSELAPIAGGWLRRDAAANWNAMNAESRRRYGVTLYPLGSMSSYRTYAQQVYLWNTVPHAHDPNWVAVPGTSNHGWGLAVDLQTHQMRQIVDQIGRRYGFSKACSDAPVEWWHIKFNLACNGARQQGNPGPVAHVDPLKGLTSSERHHVKSLVHRRHRYRAEARTGKGRRYRFWYALANREHRWIRRHMDRLAADAKKHGGGGWRKDSRGRRYQILGKALAGKFD